MLSKRDLPEHALSEEHGECCGVEDIDREAALDEQRLACPVGNRLAAGREQGQDDRRRRTSRPSG